MLQNIPNCMKKGGWTVTPDSEMDNNLAYPNFWITSPNGRQGQWRWLQVSQRPEMQQIQN